MLEFTKILYELFVKQDNSLSKSLQFMSERTKVDGTVKAAREIYKALEKGSFFSNALKTCKSIQFDEAYVSFINIAEKNGDLKTALSYLKDKLEREKECRKKIVEASVYPAFVICLAVAAAVFIGLYTETADFILLSKYVFLLLFVSAAMYFFIFRIFAEDSLFEAFTAVDFLMRNGIELAEAVGCAVQVTGPSSRTGRLFENARINLSYGMDLQTAFNCKKAGRGNFVSSLSRLSEAFYYADVGGSRDDLFGKIAAYLKEEKERKRRLCCSLIEPCLIVITGIFILAILMTFFMPLINEIGFV